MDWTIYLNDIEYDEPQGFSEMTIRAKRDDNWHGIFFEASTSDLVFYGAAATYLRQQKADYGFDADVRFKAVVNCGGEDELFAGKLDFRQYKEICGNECLVSMPVEQDGCIMKLRNRYDQKVDLSNQIAFDKQTVLTNYDGLNFQMELKAQELRAAVEGYVHDDSDVIDLSIFPNNTENFVVRPSYLEQIYENINEGQLIPSVFAASDNGISDPVISPVLLLDEEVNCFNGNFDYEVVLKGSYDYLFTSIGSISNIRLVVAKGEYPASLTILHTQDLAFAGDAAVGTFDYTFTGTTTLDQGDGFYVYFENTASYILPSLTGTITFGPETYVNINANKSCPVTNATVSLVHETASRITEAITDMCLRVKSEYFGRTDSQPFEFDADGCGSLRVLSSGLRIRNAENPVHFMSLKDIFDGLNGIDNIGMGTEGDDILRIEPKEYFYRDEEILSLPAIPKVTQTAQPNRAYSTITVGYKKWETEGINGLDEFNSNKEFRTSLSSITNSLDVTSPFIAGGYPIEQTRQLSFATSGGADSKYDNDTFIICVTRAGYSYEVEQGVVTGAANFYSPLTAYNWRIRPWYNLMRWWKSAAQSYVNLTNTLSRLIFSSGTGNLLAEGQLMDDCALENGVKAENRDLRASDFLVESLPIYEPTTANFTYPLSVKTYNLIKANPYGYISFQCGNGSFLKGFITNLLYKPAKGEADFTLIIQWPTS